METNQANRIKAKVQFVDKNLCFMYDWFKSFIIKLLKR